MEQMEQTTETNPTDTGTETDSQGFEGILSTLDSYIQDPKLATRQTLMQLKSDVMDLKDYFDGEETGEPNGLTIIIGKHKGEPK